METKLFSKKEAVKFGWGAMKAHFGFFFGILFILILINIFSGIVNKQARERTLSKERLSTVVDDVDGVFEDLIENKYINKKGVLRYTVKALKSPDDLELADNYQRQRVEIYEVLRKTDREIPPQKIIFYIFSILFQIVSILTSIGLIKIAIKLYNNEKSSFLDLFDNFSLFFKYWFSSIVYIAVIVAGLLLLIAPGIIWGIKFQFYGYFIVDKKLGPIAALKQSAKITQGAKKDLFVFSILLGLINIAGFLCLLVGLFATFPATMMAVVFVYKKLLSRLEQTETVTA